MKMYFESSPKKRTRKTTEESLAELEKEEKALQAKKKALKAKLSTEKRKQDTKEKIILGAIIKSYLGDYQEGDEGRLLAFIKAQDERGRLFSKAMDREINCENWDNFTSEYKTDLCTDLICQTERQWAKQGYLKNNENCGKELYSNNCSHRMYLYLFENEVHKASDEELKSYFAPERERINTKRRKLRAEGKRQ